MLKKSFSVDYAFTITLRPKCFAKEPEQQYDDTSEYIKRKLSSISQAFTLVAELTKNYNVHMHGIIKFPLPCKDCMKEFHKCFRNDTLVGFVNIRQIEDYQVWCKYIKKDLCHSLNGLNRRPIIYDYLDVFDSEERATFACQW